MKNFLDYHDLICETVKKLNSVDENYTWKCTYLSAKRVSLSWSYLDKGDGQFKVTLLDPIDTSDGEMFITSRTPLDDMINGHIAHETPTRIWQESYENAIVSAIRECYDYAHHCY